MKNIVDTHRVVTFLNRQELEFLDKMERDMMFSGSAHISRSKILEDLVDVLSRTQISAAGIKDNQELEARIIAAIRQMTDEQAAKKEGK